MPKQVLEMKVSVHEAEEMDRMLNEPDADNGRDEPVFDREVTFPNGNRFAVQVIASTEPDKEPCWTQGVLFQENGSELGCTDVGESFLGEYFIKDGDDEYEVVVVTNMQDHYENGECPDCGEPVPKFCVNGEACPNCGHVYHEPNRIKVKCEVEIDAPSRMTADYVASVLQFIIDAGLQDANDSSELSKEEQMGPVDDALDLNIHGPKVV